MRLVIAEKPSVAKAIAPVVGAKGRKDGYFEGNGYIVSWCYGHLVGLFWFSYTKNCVRRYLFCGIRVWKKKV